MTSSFDPVIKYGLLGLSGLYSQRCPQARPLHMLLKSRENSCTFSEREALAVDMVAWEPKLLQSAGGCLHERLRPTQVGSSSLGVQPLHKELWLHKPPAFP